MAEIHWRKSRMFFEKRTKGRSIWKTQFCSYLQYGLIGILHQVDTTTDNRLEDKLLHGLSA